MHSASQQPQQTGDKSRNTSLGSRAVTRVAELAKRLLFSLVICDIAQMRRSNILVTGGIFLIELLCAAMCTLYVHQFGAMFDLAR